MPHRRQIIALIASAGLLGAPAAASAQGVTVDPGSPSGKEYAIPLESARRQASGSGDGARQQSGERSAPLFGAGVGAPAGGTAQGGGANAGSRRGKPSAKAKQGQKRSSTAPAAGGSQSSASGDVQDAIESTKTVGATVPDGGLGSTATIVAVAVSVLLLGGVIGSIARRRAG